MPAAELSFPAGHPAAQGHFPGNPIIPGAVLLSETLRAIEAGIGVSLVPFRITSAKFLRLARPGDRVRIEFSRRSGGEIRFTCYLEGRPVLIGQMSCHALPTAT